MSKLLRAIGRAGLASMFINNGYNTFKNADAMAPMVEDKLKAWMPEQTQQYGAATMVRASSGTMVAGGTALALGIVPRLASLAVLGALVPTTLAGHAFWESTDKDEKTQQRLQFQKNLAMAGGLLFVAATGKKHC